MFTVYVDDSGSSDPKQPVAVAGALIIPAKQILALDKDWDSFKEKHGFGDLHAAECAALNQKSYPGWTSEKVQKVFDRARKIMKKRSSKAFSFTIHKEDFDAEAPKEWLQVGGENYYTWAFRTLLAQMMRWHGERRIAVPFEFVFDNAEGRDKDEIQMLMAQFESVYPGRFESHYSFRSRRLVPALQCADLLAWSCYAMSRQKFRQIPMREIAQDSFSDLSNHLERQWLDALTFEREALHQAISLDRADVEGERARQEWYRNYAATKGDRRKAL
jgi:hypothetical protein